MQPMQTANVDEFFEYTYSYPKAPAPEIPEHLPDTVRKKYEEAENAFLYSVYSGACVLYRSAMERALKALFPKSKGMLHARIRAAAIGNHFPNALIDWLDEVKAFGNDSAHEEDWDPTKQDAVQAREFASLFLTYAFTMPARVDAARRERDMRAPLG